MKSIFKNNAAPVIKRHMIDRFQDRITYTSSKLILTIFLLLVAFIGLIKNVFGLTDYLKNVSFIYQFYLDIAHFIWMPLVILAIPMIGGLSQIAFGQRASSRRDRLVIFMTFLTIILIMTMYPQALSGGLEIRFPEVLGIGIGFRIDMLGYIVLLITSIIWFLVMVYAHEYMKKENKSTRFFFFLAFTYVSVLGAIMAGDLLTMFLFFESMTIFSYMLVIHGQAEEAYKAGQNYIFMGLIGGFLILCAILLLYFNIGDLRFVSAITKLDGLGNLKYWIMGLLVLGFGIKAGMAPVHVWLPRAHPVAPTPASALLSGIMIKVGAFGILRTATSYFFPSKEAVSSYADPIWLTIESIGAIIIWFGIITMVVGVFLALQQSNIKRMLAYHSVSQMGYIVLGIGVSLYLGYKGAMGYSGAIYHIINHALFKSLLFMVAGVVFYHTHEADMYKLGGLWKKLPFTAIICLIAALGISGIPLFNGFISKSLLHHGIVEAYTYGDKMFFFAEILFILVSAGTVCSFIKMYYYVFIRKTDRNYDHIKREFSCLDSAMGLIAILIVIIGVFPKLLLNEFILPQLRLITFDPDFIEHYIVDAHFFTSEDLWMTVLVVFLGVVLFFAGSKFHWFHIKLPRWFSLEYLFFLPAFIIMRLICRYLRGDRCPIEYSSYNLLNLKNDNQTGFVDRFVITMKAFNLRFEASIIKSDALIYTGFITLVLLFMFIFGRF